MIATIFVDILDFIFILFLPGFFISLVFLRWEKIDIIERIVLSFALSLAVIPLVIFYTNLLGVPITILSVMLEDISIILLSFIILVIQIWTNKK